MPIELDIPTLLVTLVVTPILLAALRRFAYWGKSLIRFATDAFLWAVSKSLKHSVAARVSLRRYSKANLEAPENKYLQVPGTETALETDKVFVPLKGELPGQGEHHVSYAALDSLGNRVRIVGDPGSGKSTLAKRLFRDACRASVRSPRQGMLPVLVELRGLQSPPNDPAQSEWIFNVVRQQVVSFAGFDMEQCFESCVTGPGILLLLDGLDEVSSTQYDRVAEGIIAVSKKLLKLSPNNAVILTMRSQFHQTVKKDFDSDFPPTLYIQGFSSNEIYEFLSKWPFVSEPTARINEIYAELTDRPMLREICSNPLVLGMYVASAQQRDTTDVPETRTEFYNRVLDELLVRRRARQLRSTQARSKLKEDRERILGCLSLENLLDDSQTPNVISWDRAVAVVGNILETQTYDDAERELRELSKETGVLTEERSGESLRFMHLTFCEFLAAKESVEGRELGFDSLMDAHRRLRLSPQAQATRLIEVLAFATGLLPPVSRPQAISSVAELGDRTLLSRCFLETKSYEHEAWPEFVTQEAAALRSASDGWDQEWLGRLQTFSVALADADASLSHRSRPESKFTLEEFFRQLARDNSEQVLTLFDAYASRDAAAAFRLAESFGLDVLGVQPDVVARNCSDPPFLSLVRIRAEGCDSDCSEWAFVLAEACLMFGVVAKQLRNEPIPAGWAATLSSVPSRLRWDRTFSPSILSASLSIGANQVQANPDRKASLPLLWTWSRMRAPLVRGRGSFVVTMLLWLLIIGGTLIWFASPTTGSIGSSLAFYVSGSIVLYVIPLVMIGHRLMQRRAANLVPLSQLLRIEQMREGDPESIKDFISHQGVLTGYEGVAIRLASIVFRKDARVFRTLTNRSAILHLPGYEAVRRN